MENKDEEKWIEKLKLKRRAEIQSMKEQAEIERKLSKEDKPERFHGAFTGGFSAGYFNTVGSEEGFKPAKFVSSRLKKAEKRTAKVLDYMDEEDLEQIVKLDEDDEGEDIVLEKRFIFNESTLFVV